MEWDFFNGGMLYKPALVEVLHGAPRGEGKRDYPCQPMKVDKKPSLII